MAYTVAHIRAGGSRADRVSESTSNRFRAVRNIHGTGTSRRVLVSSSTSSPVERCYHTTSSHGYEKELEDERIKQYPRQPLRDAALVCMLDCATRERRETQQRLLLSLLSSLSYLTTRHTHDDLRAGEITR